MTSTTDGTSPVTPPRKFTARETVYNGITMRSGLEARYARWLDEIHAEWEYEPRRYATTWGDYLPDFRLANVVIADRVRTVYVELKPTAAHAQAARHQIKVIWASEPDAFIVIEAEGLRGPIVFFPPDLRATPALLVWTRAGSGRPALSRPLAQTWRYSASAA